MEDSPLRHQLIEFHRRGNVPVLDEPQVPPEDRMRLRLSLVAEEFREFMEAALGQEAVKGLKAELERLIREEPLQVDLVKLTDAMADLDYVVEGTRVECGVNGQPIANEVHRKNMAKYGPGSWMREDGKVMKPPGWTPPDIAALLRDQGWGDEP